VERRGEGELFLTAYPLRQGGGGKKGEKGNDAQLISMADGRVAPRRGKEEEGGKSSALCVTPLSDEGKGMQLIKLQYVGHERR